MLIAGETLEQGDILEACPIFRPSKEFPWPLGKEDGETIKFERAELDIVIVSQSCDLVARQKLDMGQVLLCPVWRISEAANVNPFLESAFGKEQCRRGNLPGYHMIDGCSDSRWRREVSVISFRDVWGLPLAFVRKVAAASARRARLRPPYKEHLAQAFARYFMRVGLPTPIEPFRSPRAERKVMERLYALGDEARARVIKPFL